MAGFDPSDIRSEMAAAGVGQGDTTPPTSPPNKEQAIVPIVEDPVPLEIIAPGEPGNEIDVDNPPNFEELKRANPPPPWRRLSKRQAGVDPNCHPTKRYKTEQERRPFILDPDFASDDDSSDDDFEIVARPKKVTSTVEEGTSKVTEDVDPELDISLASFLMELRKGKEKVSTDAENPSCESSDKEMAEEFAINKQVESSDNSQSSNTSSSEFIANETTTETSSSESSRGHTKKATAAVSATGDSSVSTSVVNTEDNTEDYDLKNAVSNQFYSDEALSLWPVYANREFIREKHIDLETYGKQNVTALLKARNILSTVTSAMPFCKKAVLEFYCHLTEEVSQVNSIKYGRVFVRNHIYNFNPSIINEYYHTTVSDAAEVHIDETTFTITGGLITKFPSMPQRLAAASLTSLYSVLHKTAIWNWTPSTNSTNVTRPQVLVLYAIGTGQPFDFGQHVFNTVLAFANGGLKSTKLPFPSLIYGILESQGFTPDINEHLTGEADILKLAPALLKGNRKIDLPYNADSVGPSVANTEDNTNPSVGPNQAASSTSKQTPTYVTISTEYIQSQIDFAQRQIVFYQEQVAELQLILEVATHSGQQGGVGSGNEGVEGIDAHEEMGSGRNDD